VDTVVAFREEEFRTGGIGIGPNIDEAEFKKRCGAKSGRKVALRWKTNYLVDQTWTPE